MYADSDALVDADSEADVDADSELLMTHWLTLTQSYVLADSEADVLLIQMPMLTLTLTRCADSDALVD